MNEQPLVLACTAAAAINLLSIIVACLGLLPLAACMGVVAAIVVSVSAAILSPRPAC